MEHSSPKSWRITSGLTLAAAATAAGVTGKNPARTWQRWESGQLKPPLKVIDTVGIRSGGAVTLHSWQAAREAFLNATNTALPDSTAGHARGSSPHPIPDTEQSLEPSASADQVAPARDGVVSTSSCSPSSSAPVGAHQDS